MKATIKIGEREYEGTLEIEGWEDIWAWSFVFSNGKFGDLDRDWCGTTREIMLADAEAHGITVEKT